MSNEIVIYWINSPFLKSIFFFQSDSLNEQKRETQTIFIYMKILPIAITRPSEGTGNFVG